MQEQILNKVIEASHILIILFSYGVVYWLGSRQRSADDYIQGFNRGCKEVIVKLVKPEKEMKND